MADKMALRKMERDRGLATMRRDPFFSPFYEFFDEFFSRPGFPGFGSERWAPALDLYDKPDEVLVKVDLPGWHKEDLHIQVSGNLLTVSGTSGKDVTDDKERVRGERYWSSFERSVTLPAEVDGSKAKAVLKEGVLELTLPKLEEAKQKRIEIEVK